MFSNASALISTYMVSATTLLASIVTILVRTNTHEVSTPYESAVTIIVKGIAIDMLIKERNSNYFFLAI